MEEKIIKYNGNEYKITMDNGQITIERKNGEKLHPDMLEYAEVLKLANKQLEKANEDMVTMCVDVLVEEIHKGNLTNIEQITGYIKKNFTKLSEEQQKEVYSKAEEIISKEYAKEDVVNKNIYDVIVQKLESAKNNANEFFACNFNIHDSLLTLEAINQIGETRNSVDFHESTTWEFTEEIKNRFLNQIAVLFAESDHHINRIEKQGVDNYRFNLKTRTGAYLSINGMSEAYARELDKLITEKTRVQDSSLTMDDSEFSLDNLNQEQQERDAMGPIIQDGGIQNEEERVRELEGPVRVRRNEDLFKHGNMYLPFIIIFILEGLMALALITYLIYK